MTIRNLLLMIFFITFTTVNINPHVIPACEDNVACKHSIINSDEIKVICNANYNREFSVNIKLGDNLQIICNNWKGWLDFYFPCLLSKKMLNSLHFKHCRLSDTINLKQVVIQFGTKDTNTLIFQSFKNLGVSLNRWYLQGFPELRKLVLSHNGLTNISKDLFSDYPKLEWIDLSNNNLVLTVGIFDATPNLKRLELTESLIERIKVGTFDKLQNLEFLDLSKNQLAELKAGIFDKLVSLKSLNLSQNILSDLSEENFDKLNKLETLDISFNNFSLIPSNLFDENKELRQLYLHDNIIFLLTLPDNFLANLTKLEEVFLNNNGFTNLPENLFWGSSLLRKIVLENNFLVTLPQNIFKGLRNVVELSIKNNKIVTPPDRIFEDMGNLEKLDLSMNLIDYISRDMFQGMRSLVELNMERNQLKFIDREAFLPIINLKIAKLSYNLLILTHMSKRLSVFYNNDDLMELHLSNNNISYFFDEWWIGNDNIRLLNLSHNNITSLTLYNFIFPSHQIRIDLRYNKIRSIHLNHIEDVVSLSNEERNIVVLIDHNPLLCDCSLYNLLRYRENKMSAITYKYFDIVLGNITCSKPDETEMIEISKLHSDTYTCLEHEYFRTVENCQIGCTCSIRLEDETRILDCSYKNISEFLIDETRINFVGEYPLILNLTGNFLTEIPSIELLKPINVIGLLLSNNHISQITADKLPKSLTALELHNNSISKIDSNVLSHLNCMSLENFTLSGNPVICNCDTQDLVYYVQAQRLYYKDLDNLKCKDIDLLMYEITNKELCSSELTTTMITFFVVTLVTALFFIWWHRNNIKSLFSRNGLQVIFYYIYRPRIWIK